MQAYYKISIIFNSRNLDLVTGILNLNLNLNSFETFEANNNIELITYIEYKKIKLNILKKTLDINIKTYIIKYSIKLIKYNKKIESSYKKYFKTNKITKNIIIKPSWIMYKKANRNELIINIDPGLAFGTGLHETTKGIIKLFNFYKNTLDKNLKILDAGTGSGILSIVAYKLGFKNILAIDNDIEAINVAKDNFSINKTINITAKAKDLNKIRSKFNIILANIISGTLIDNYLNFIKLSKKGTFIFMSGILDTEKNKVIQTFTLDNNFKLIRSLKLKEWVSLVFKKV